MNGKELSTGDWLVFEHAGRNQVTSPMGSCTHTAFGSESRHPAAVAAAHSLTGDGLVTKYSAVDKHEKLSPLRIREADKIQQCVIV